MNDSELSASELNDLIFLAGLCPGTNGMVIYMARALYLQIMGKVYNAPFPCNEREGSRPTAISSQTKIAAKLWNVEIFPNPASNQVSLVSKTEIETLNICIKDLSNRIIFNQTVKTTSFIANLDLSLVNGAYLITISNQKNEIVTKKLLIAK